MRRNNKRFVQKLSKPKTWSIGARRTFALTFPLSVPLWGLANVAVRAASITAKALSPLVSFWSDPPEKPRSSGYEGYSSHRSRSDKVIPIEEVRGRREAA